MPRHAVADEIRRVVARLGGRPPTHHVDGPRANVASPADAARDVARAVAVAVDAEAMHSPPPGTGVLVATVPAVEARASSTHLPLAATGRLAMPPPARIGSTAAALPHAGTPAAVPVAVDAPGSATADLHVATPGLHSEARPFAASWRRVGPLPGRAAPRRRRTLPRVLFLARRRRIPAATVPRGRLAAAWATLLREHPHPQDSVAFVGLYGPLPLGAVVGARLEADGTTLTELRRVPIPGPRGDLVMAIHRPTGTVLRTAYPRGAERRGRLR